MTEEKPDLISFTPFPEPKEKTEREKKKRIDDLHEKEHEDFLRAIEDQYILLQLVYTRYSFLFTFGTNFLGATWLQVFESWKFDLVPSDHVQNTCSIATYCNEQVYWYHILCISLNMNEYIRLGYAIWQRAGAGMGIRHHVIVVVLVFWVQRMLRASCMYVLSPVRGVHCMIHAYAKGFIV